MGEGSKNVYSELEANNSKTIFVDAKLMVNKVIGNTRKPVFKINFHL